MLSMNQLSLSGQEFQNSKGYYNTYNNNNNSSKKGNNNMTSNNMSIFDNQSNSRQLFKKCKHIIQQQMIQIAKLSEENERLSGKISMMQEKNQEQKINTHGAMRENAEVREKNELLHKQMSKLRKTIEELSKELINKQNTIKLKDNKIQFIEDALCKVNLQKSALKEKSEILQQTVQLLQRQLSKSQEIVWQKESQMRLEIEELRRVKMMLERNGKVEGVDEELGNGVADNMRNKFTCRPYFTVKEEESPFQKVDLINQLKSLQKTQFSSTQLRRDHHQNNRSNTITPFSIMDERQNSSPVSRIRKNFSKPKNKDETTPQTNNTRKSSDNSISKQKLTLTGKLSSKRDSSFMANSNQHSNPEISQELSNIKKEILQQYSKIQIKKGLISHDRINQTLQQIENKLQKMVRISAMDESQSQLQ